MMLDSISPVTIPSTAVGKNGQPPPESGTFNQFLSLFFPVAPVEVDAAEQAGPSLDEPDESFVNLEDADEDISPELIRIKQYALRHDPTETVDNPTDTAKFLSSPKLPDINDETNHPKIGLQLNQSENERLPDSPEIASQSRKSENEGFPDSPKIGLQSNKSENELPPDSPKIGLQSNKLENELPPDNPEGGLQSIHRIEIQTEINSGSVGKPTDHVDQRQQTHPVLHATENNTPERINHLAITHDAKTRGQSDVSDADHEFTDKASGAKESGYVKVDVPTNGARPKNNLRFDVPSYGQKNNANLDATPRRQRSKTTPVFADGADTGKISESIMASGLFNSEITADVIHSKRKKNVVDVAGKDGSLHAARLTGETAAKPVVEEAPSASEAIRKTIEKINTLLKSGGGSAINFRVRDEALGELRFRLNKVNDKYRIKIMTGNEQTKQILAENLNFIKRTFQLNAYEIGSISVNGEQLST